MYMCVHVCLYVYKHVCRYVCVSGGARVPLCVYMCARELVCECVFHVFTQESVMFDWHVLMSGLPSEVDQPFSHRVANIC